MNDNAEKLIYELTPAIVEKCRELKAARAERLKTRLFVILCAAVAIIPATFVFFGISVATLIVPVAFMSLSAIMLLPVLTSKTGSVQGGNRYEQI